MISCIVPNALADIKPTKLGNLVRGLQTHFNLDYAISFYLFGEVIQAYIHHLKYSGWSIFLPRLINNAIKGNELQAEASNAVLIPIPLQPVRQRDRGFNQAGVIASELAHQWNLAMDKTLLKGKNIPKHKRLSQFKRDRKICT